MVSLYDCGEEVEDDAVLPWREGFISFVESLKHPKNRLIYLEYVLLLSVFMVMTNRT